MASLRILRDETRAVSREAERRSRRGAPRGENANARRRTKLIASTLFALTLAADMALAPGTAHAFTIETLATRGCHEEITIDAWRVTKEMLPDATAPLPSLGDDEALIADVPFGLPGDLDDIGVATLLLGIRNNDIKGHAATDLGELASINAAVEAQKEHCLRSPEHDEPNGSQLALEECRMFIRETLISSLDGLGDDGRPDGSKRERLTVALAIRDEITVEVPTFHLRAGRAIHAIQDSFTHTFRNTADPHLVTVVLNFAEYAENELDESVDGPAHMTDLDSCDDDDALLAERRKLAIEASAVALRALLDPADRDGKVRAIDAMLNEYLTFDTTSDCSADNDWCDAPELAYESSACGCRAAGAGPGAASAASLLALLGAVAARRSRRRRRRQSAFPLALSVLVATLLASPGAALAQEGQSFESGPIESPVAAIEGKSSAATPGKEDTAGAFFARVSAAVSYDRPGFAGGAGLRYQLSKPWMFGFDAEWNPWIALSPGKVRPGAINAYVSAIRRFQLKTESVNVRTTAALGASYLLFDLVGAPSGSIGPFFGLSLLGAEWKAAPGFYLTIDPTYIAIPVPHITGTPFAYMQYRFQVGLEFGG